MIYYTIYYMNDINDIFVYPIKKLGRLGLTDKDRLLVMTEDKISYYKIFDRKDVRFKNFFYRYDLVKDYIYSKSKILNSQLDDIDFNKLSLEFLNLIQRSKNKLYLKSNLVDDMQGDLNDNNNKKLPINEENKDEKIINIIQDDQKKELKHNEKLDLSIYHKGDIYIKESVIGQPLKLNFKTKNYLYPLEISDIELNKETTDFILETEMMKNENNKKKNTSFKDENNKKKKSKIWIFDFKNPIYLEKFKTLYENFKKKKSNINNNKDIVDNNQTNVKKDDLNKKNKEDITKEIDQEPDIIQQFSFIEIIYQNLISSYRKLLHSSNENITSLEKNVKLFKLEMLIINIINKFKEKCFTIVKKIITDLGRFDNQQNSANNFFYKIPPIIYPSLDNFKNTSVFLYSVFGINFHLTFYNYQLKKDYSKIYEKQEFKGIIQSLYDDYYHRDFYSDMFIKLNKDDAYRVPLTCIIEYMGFTILCESDLYNKDDISINADKKENIVNEVDNQLLNLLINKEKEKNLNFVIHVTNSSISNKETDKIEKSIFYSNNLKFFSKGEIKNLEDLIFETTNIYKIYFKEEIDKFEEMNLNLNEDKEKEKEKEKDNDENKNDIKDLINIKINLGRNEDNIFKMTSLVANEKIIINMKYIMKLNCLVQIENSDIKINEMKNDKLNKKLYFKPEFIESFLFQKSNKTIDNDSNDSFKLLKKYLFKDGETNNITDLKKYFKEIHIPNFINMLESMFLKPFDSNSLRIYMKKYGINSYFLGVIAEDTRVPHVREICLIDMIARVCKNLLFKILSYIKLKKAIDQFYPPESVKKEEPKNEYSQILPISFNLNYSELLRTICVFNDYRSNYNVDIKNNKNQINTKGIYRAYWSKNNNTNNFEKEIKKLFETNEKSTNQNQPDQKIEENNKIENENMNLLKKEIVDFFKTLFNFSDKPVFTIKIGEIIYDNNDLWKLIQKNLKDYYSLRTDELYKLCNPKFISMQALFNSIQEYSGIIFKISTINNTKFSYIDVINQEFSEDMIAEIKPIIKSYNFRHFSINQFKISAYYFDPIIDYKEGYLLDSIKLSIRSKLYKEMIEYSDYRICYCILMDKINSNSFILNSNTSNYDYIFELVSKYEKSKDKNKEKIELIDELCANQSITTYQKFTSIYYKIIYIINSFIYKEKYYDKDFSLEIEIVKDYITNYWHRSHPYIAFIFVIFLRFYFFMKNDFFNITHEKMYQEIILIIFDLLGKENLYVSGICEEIAQFYVLKERYSEVLKYLMIAHKFYNQIWRKFSYCYMNNLRRIIKYLIMIGDYKEALQKGKELVENYLEIYKSNEKTENLNDFNIDSIILNILEIAKIDEKWIDGNYFAKKLFYIILQYPNSYEYSLLKYKDYKKIVREKKYDPLKKGLNLKSEEYIKVELPYLLCLIYKFALRNLDDVSLDKYVRIMFKLFNNSYKLGNIRSSLEMDIEKIKEMFRIIKDDKENKIEDMDNYIKYLIKKDDNNSKNFHLEKIFNMFNGNEEILMINDSNGY